VAQENDKNQNVSTDSPALDSAVATENPVPADSDNDSVDDTATDANAAPTDPTPPASNTDPVSPELPDFSGTLADDPANGIELLNDVELDVKIELGRTEMEVENILRLTNGSVIELDKLAGDPVDIMVNEKLVARGEVLVINDNFCVRINEIIKGKSFAAREKEGNHAHPD